MESKDKLTSLVFNGNFMFKKILTFFILSICLFSVVFSQTEEKPNVAVVKKLLPEFRDASLWKGRAGLVRFSPDGKMLAVSGKSADIVIYDTETGDVKSKLEQDGAKAFSFNPDGKSVAIQSLFDSSLQIFEIESGKRIRSIQGIDKLSKFEKTLGGSGLINTANGVFPMVPLEMGNVLVSPDWKTLLINKNDKEYKLYDYATGEFKYELEHANFNATWEVTKSIFAIAGLLGGTTAGFDLLGSASNAQFSRDSKLCVVTNGNKKPTIWNVETGKLVAMIESKDRIFYVQFSPNGKMLASSDFRGTVRIWDTENGREISSFGSKPAESFLSHWSGNSEQIFVMKTRKPNSAEVFEAKTGKHLYGFDGSNVLVLVNSNTGKFIATVPRKGKTIYYQLWEAETGKLIATIPKTKEKKPLTSLKWSPNDEMILTTSGLRNEVELWDTKGMLSQTLPNAIFPTQFSYDGKFLATGGKTADPKNDIGFLWEFRPASEPQKSIY
jgi:WD40 repeat protein